jgi:site-specific DNA-methyltransferase (adenine-specific)
MRNEVHLMDCMELMRGYPDGYFELACVDPPYGLGLRTVEGGSKKNTQTKFIDDLKKKRWDNDVPTQSYWDELFRVSRNQVVWGGNYFGLPAHRTFIVWDKMTYVPTMSQIEQAWTSFDSPARLIKINSNQPDRTHPTQKPIALYDWIFANYAKEGDKILDTHVGSGSSRIAAHRAGLDFIGAELDPDYWAAQEKRYKDFKSQLTLF